MQGVKFSSSAASTDSSSAAESAADASSVTEDCTSGDDKKRKCAPVTDSRALRSIPILHFSECRLPFISCVSLDRGGEFEQNLASLKVEAGKDFFFFC